MENQNLKVFTKLITDQGFLADMEQDVDLALAKANYNVDPEFVEKLKSFGKKHGFRSFSNSNAKEVNESLTKHFELDPRW